MEFSEKLASLKIDDTESVALANGRFLPVWTGLYTIKKT